jgi:hypothetical protein
MIVEASFRAGDLPNPEKHGIITGLPKADKKTVYMSLALRASDLSLSAPSSGA